MNLRFRHIEGFRAVMHAGTATGAASLLNVTQPAISQLMSDLEATIGIALFDRRGGRLVPTENADRLYEEVERSFTGLEHISAFCDQMKQSAGNAVIVAVIPSIALTILPAAIGRYVRTVARDFFTLCPRHSNDAVRLVGSQKADIGFGSRPINAPGIHCELISRYNLLCAVPLDHALAKRRTISARHLQGQPFLAMSRSEGIDEDVRKLFQRLKVNVSVIGECPMSAASCALVESGVGITLVDHAAASFFVERKVALRRFTPSMPVNFYAYWLEKSEPRYRRSKFVAILKEEASRMEVKLDEQLAAQLDALQQQKGIESAKCAL